MNNDKRNSKAFSRTRRKAVYTTTKLFQVATGWRAVQEIYEGILWNQLSRGRIPSHIGVILDGNRRWALRRGLEPWEGHRQGARKVEELLDWCGDIGIQTITLYAFSTENFQRSSREVAEIFRLLEAQLQGLLQDGRIQEKGIRVKVLGRTQMLSEDLRELIGRVEAHTAHHRRHYLNFAIAYGGRTEIVDAVKALARDVKEDRLAIESISEEAIDGYLYTAHLPKSSPDLIIRTSGEIRLSNFMTWQSAYSELMFTDVFWPDFRKLDLLRAIRVYQKRGRRFGK